MKDIIIIGGAHVDIAGIPEHKLRHGEKNYGKITFSPGGVAYNAAYNLSCLGFKPSLISLVCDDINSQIVTDACRDNNIDISKSIRLKGMSTPKYLYVSDFDGETRCGISDMSLYNEITPELLRNKIDYINSFKMCFIDGNLSYNSLKFLLENITIYKIVDPVSVDHCAKLMNIIWLADAIKPNDKELYALSGILPDSKENMEKAKNYFLDKGVKQVFFSMGNKGLYFGDCTTSGIINNKPVNIINTNGAGDCMVSGLIYGYLNNYDTIDMARLGTAAAHISLENKNINKDTLNIYKLLKKMEEIK